MRSGSLLLIGVVALIAVVGVSKSSGAVGEVGYQFDAPEALNARGIAIRSDGLIFCSGVAVINELVTPMLVAVDMIGGTASKSFVIDYLEHPTDEVQPRGCAWDGQRVWVLDSGTVPRLLAIDPCNGSLLSSFQVEARMIGLCTDGNLLFCLKSKAGGGTIVKYDFNGQQQGTQELPTTVGGQQLNQAFGLATDGTRFYCSATVGQSDSMVFRLSADGSCDLWFVVPDTTLYDLAFDGYYVWAVEYVKRKIVRIDVGEAGQTGTVAVKVLNGSEFAEGCALPNAEVLVSPGGAGGLRASSDEMGRTVFWAVPSGTETRFVISKPGFSQFLSDVFAVQAGGMQTFECSLAPRSGMVIPCDASFDLQWGLFNPDNGADINAPAAWKIDRGNSSEVVVAIISTGIDLNHPDLASKLWTNAGEKESDGIDNDGNGYVDDVFGWYFDRSGRGSSGVFDEDGQGTAAAGIVAAAASNSSDYRDSEGQLLNIAGTSWGAKIMALRFDGSRQAMWEAIRYAVNEGARVILIPNGFEASSAQLWDAVSYAVSNDVVIVSGTGDTGGASTYPASFENVLAVGATDKSGNRAPYSSFGIPGDGTKVDVVAPGGLGGPGLSEGIFTTLPTYHCTMTDHGYSSGYDFVHGTAYAAAFAAGVCALIRSHSPQATYADVLAAVKRGARYIDDAAAEQHADDKDGLGRWNNRTGYGLIDAEASLSGASADLPPIVEYAGFGPSSVTEAQGGDLFVFAKVSTPDGRNDISSVEIFFSGEPTGLFLHDDGLDGDAVRGDGVFTFFMRLLPGTFTKGHYLIEIIATDSSGLQSDMWPYLSVHAGAKRPLAPLALSDHTAAAANGQPVILAAGFCDSSITTQGGTVRVEALVSDPDGLDDVSGVELLLAGGVHLGIWLRDDGQQGDEVAHDGIFTLYTDAGRLDQGDLLLELVAYDREGHKSDTWPYLVVH